MADKDDRHGWIDLLVPDGPFLSAAALDVTTVGENWPTRLDAGQRSLLMADPASDSETGSGWDDSTWDGRRARVLDLLTELLGYREGKTLAVAPNLVAQHHIYRAAVAADFVIHAPDDPDDVRMVVMCGPDVTDEQDLLAPNRTHAHDGWVSTPVQRAALLARSAGADLALVTNGREHLLVNVVTGTTGSAMWTVNGLEDRNARNAFVALLHRQRVLHRTVPLSRLIALSQDRQHELTDTLGRQVRRAAEAMVNAISRTNRASRGRLLEGLTGQQVYAATTRVLMRTVFLLVAEERGLLPVAENQLYAEQYAISTLLDRLEEDAYRNRSAMERRSGAWQRMMALSRAVHAGIEHDHLRLPAYGGSLFDPDESPFLEARVPSGGDDGYEQIDVGVVDDFTVLIVLRHLQIANGQRISYRSLDVEQIGHVYEALLDHSAVVVPQEHVAVLGLIGKAGNEPELPLVELEGWAAKSDKELGKQLVDMGVAAEARGVYNALDAGLLPGSEVAQTLNVAVANDAVLRERVEPYAPLLRTDARGVALIFLPGDVYVTETSSKRDSGTAYTPRSLADEVAKYTLGPLVYDPGPQNEPDESKWRLKSPEQILDLKVCDPAVGSAAILVAVVRYLAEALLQGSVEAGDLSPKALTSGASDVESVDARVQARRAIVSRCIYGVDRDPMAVEMAKLSLWLITMARDEPFTFLDHAIRLGDSLLGITSTNQLRRLHLGSDEDIFGLHEDGLLASAAVYQWRDDVETTLVEMANLRQELRRVKVERVDDAEYQATLHSRSESLSTRLVTIADAVTAACLVTDKKKETARLLTAIAGELHSVDDPAVEMRIRRETDQRLNHGNPMGAPRRLPLHWPLAFPEVFIGDKPQFDAIVGNPPFLGGSRISGILGSDYRSHLSEYVAERRGNADLVAFFCLRSALISHRFGLLATNSISQGASQEVALSQLCSRGRFIRAAASEKWPGSASVHISKLWWTSENWEMDVWLDGKTVPDVGPDLLPVGRVAGRPFRLPGQARRVSEGVKLYGEGFVLDEQEARSLIEREPRNAEVVFPYVTGHDINSSPDHRSGRWCINFHDMSLEEAKTRHPAIIEIVRERVKPYRETVRRAATRENWWLPEERRPRLMQHMDGLLHVIVMARVSSRLMPVRIETGPVFSDKVVVVPSGEWYVLGLMSSTIHRVWAERYTVTLETRITYVASDVFDTFPFPTAGLEEIGSHAEALSTRRQGLMRQRGENITTLYGRFHDDTDSTIDVIELRERHVRLDQLVLRAFGWEDIDLSHAFADTRYGRYFTISSDARFELLMRLLELNFERYAKETGRELSEIVTEAQFR